MDTNNKESFMDIIETIRSRKSIRGYKPDPVAKEVLESILNIATRAPSSINTQPWKIDVVTGEVMEKIQQGNVEAMKSGRPPNFDVPFDTYEGIYKKRQVGLVVELFRLMEISREDNEKRTAWAERGYRIFDAPAAFILSVDKSLNSVRAYSDLGGLAQTICLAAMHYGLGTCINGQGILYSDVVRKFVDIPVNRLIFLCIAIGYPDWDFPANQINTERESLDNNTSWHGF
jgi:nitroreductase